MSNLPLSPSNAPSAGSETVRAYVETFAQAPPRALIANLDTRLETVCAADGEWMFPMSVNDGAERGNCYVCSPHAHYVDYAAYEVSLLRRPLVEAPLRGLLAGAGVFFRRAALDRVVIVNNWLLSTNLYPSGWRGEGLPELIDGLIARYPGHAILFRSLNALQNPALLAVLRRAGAGFLAGQGRVALRRRPRSFQAHHGLPARPPAPGKR